jgi:hypothetical protein
VICNCCNGQEYFVSSREGSSHTPNGALAIERCDECQYWGEGDVRSKYDEDLAVKVRRETTVRARMLYPCLLLYGKGPSVLRSKHATCPGCGRDFHDEGIDLTFHDYETPYPPPDGEGAESFWCRTYLFGPNLVLMPTAGFSGNDDLNDAQWKAAQEPDDGCYLECPSCSKMVDHEWVNDRKELPNGPDAARWCPECGYRGDTDYDEWFGDNSVCKGCMEHGAELHIEKEPEEPKPPKPRPGKRVHIEVSQLVEMICERLQDYDNDDLVAFWKRNFDHDPVIEVDDEGNLVATYED